MLGWFYPTVVYRGRRLAAAQHCRAAGRSRCTDANADARAPATDLRIVAADTLAPLGPDHGRYRRTLADRGRHRDTHTPAADADAAARGDGDANDGTDAAAPGDRDANVADAGHAAASRRSDPPAESVSRTRADG
jgi:hypothetical protein